MSVKVKELDKSSAEARKTRETAVKRALDTGKKRSEINVQELRDQEGKLRGKTLFEMLKSKREHK